MASLVLKVELLDFLTHPARRLSFSIPVRWEREAWVTWALRCHVLLGPPPSLPRSFSSHHLSMASIMVVDSPGFQNPRHQGKERAATFEELCRNYTHERLQLLFYQRTFVATLQRHREVRRQGALRQVRRAV